jgi:hypothetical protein
LMQEANVGNLPDLEEIEDALRQLEVLPPALWSPELRAKHAQLVERSARLLIELHERGWIRLYTNADGKIAAEFLSRPLH